MDTDTWLSWILYKVYKRYGIEWREREVKLKLPTWLESDSIMVPSPKLVFSQYGSYCRFREHPPTEQHCISSGGLKIYQALNSTPSSQIPSYDIILKTLYSRFLLRHGLCHQLIDLCSVIGHGHHKKRLVICEHRVILNTELVPTWRRVHSQTRFLFLAWLTCCYRAHQHGAQLDDWTEDVFGLGRACQILTVALQDQLLILPLQQHQDVL